MPLESLDEKESQRRYAIHCGAGCQLALFEQIGLIASKFVRSLLVGRLAEMLGKVVYNPQALASSDLRVVATLKFLQHHLA
jgi:hypothetical protein